MAVRAPELRSVFFEPGGRVRIQPSASDRSYQCFIEDVPNGALHLTMPMDGRDYASIPTGKRVQIAVERRGNLYWFDSIVTGRRFGEHPMLVVKRPSDQSATQRRAQVRVPVLFEATLWLPDEHRPGHERDAKITIVNVSAGGLGFRGKEHVAPGTEVTVDLLLPSDHRRREAPRRTTVSSPIARSWSRRPVSYAAHARQRQEDRHGAGTAAAGTQLSMTARVVHCAMIGKEPEPEPEQPGRRVPRVYRGGVEFTEIGDIVRERIIRFVVRREVELRVRGLL